MVLELYFHIIDLEMGKPCHKNINQNAVLAFVVRKGSLPFQAMQSLFIETFFHWLIDEAKLKIWQEGDFTFFFLENPKLKSKKMKVLFLFADTQSCVRVVMKTRISLPFFAIITRERMNGSV